MDFDIRLRRIYSDICDDKFENETKAFPSFNATLGWF